MFAVRIHGRGGQGVVTAAELLSVAAFGDGRWAQAFPMFGSERAGAPVTAFCRIADDEVRTREPVTEPDGVVVLDPTLLSQVDVFAGLHAEGYLLVNTARSAEQVLPADVRSHLLPGRCATVAATELARQHVGRPVPNVVALGGFAALTDVVSLACLLTTIRERFPGPVGEGNAAGAEAAYRLVSGRSEVMSHAAAD